MNVGAACTYPTRRCPPRAGAPAFAPQTCNNTVCAAPYAQTQTGILNPQAYKAAADFFACPAGQGVTTRDARLFDAPRTQRFGLDAVPSDGSVFMDDVYDAALVPDAYNRPYRTYADIVGGDVRYYIDPDVAPPFRSQIYSADGVTRVDMFVTPMGAVEPMFYLQPLQSTFNNTSKDTRTRDALAFRNDITALQQRGHNKSRYEALK